MIPREVTSTQCSNTECTGNSRSIVGLWRSLGLTLTTHAKHQAACRWSDQTWLYCNPLAGLVSSATGHCTSAVLGWYAVLCTLVRSPLSSPPLPCSGVLGLQLRTFISHLVAVLGPSNSRRQLLLYSYYSDACRPRLWLSQPSCNIPHRLYLLFYPSQLPDREPHSCTLLGWATRDIHCLLQEKCSLKLYPFIVPHSRGPIFKKS